MVNTAGFSQLNLNPADRLRFIFMRLSVARIEARLRRTTVARNGRYSYV
jgi:hypothetical protein